MRTSLPRILLFGVVSLALARPANADDVADAYRAMKNGDPDVAIAYCNRALQTDPDEYGAYNNRSWA